MKLMPCLLPLFVALASPAAGQSPQGVPSKTEARPLQPLPFVPAGFDPPRLVETPRFKLVPFSPALVDLDFRAYMSSIDHLQKTFSRSTKWPRPGITHADAVKDMENEQAQFTTGRSFDYSVEAPDGSRELGSVYVSPSPVAGYDAVVRIWVTKEQYDAGFDAELYAWVRQWVRDAWPFKKVAYPGRAIDWRSWDRIVAEK